MLKYMIHLIYLHQGHTALPSELEALARIVEPLLGGESFIAKANPWPTSTIYGIEPAAQRAANELTEILQSRPEITHLSLVGVSLGGVILERVAQIMYNEARYPGIRHDPQTRVVTPELKFFIAFASPLNGITVGWNLATLAAKVIGWLDPTLKDLVEMHDKSRETVMGISLFEKRICLGNLHGDWRVPLSSAFPVGGSWPWSVGTQRLVQRAIDGSSCVWHAVVLDLHDRWRPHNAIVDDERSQSAIKQIVNSV